MLENILKNLVAEKKREGISNPVIRNILKGTLQHYFLDFICNSQYGKDLIFCGGSALRICFGLNRLSEDLDFDLEEGKDIDKEKLAEMVVDYFRKNLNYRKVEIKISGRQKKIYFKFPILHSLSIAKEYETDKLYVKVEIERNISKFYQTEFTPVAIFNLNFVVKNYTLSTLMASKIIVVMKRTFRKGKGDKITFKGRDYYDLLWFLQKKIVPDMDRTKDVLNIVSLELLYKELEKQIKKINTAYLKEDIINLFEDTRFIENYCKNYKIMAKKYLSQKGFGE